MNAWKWMVVLGAATLTTAACNAIIGADEPIVVDETDALDGGDNDNEAGEKENDASQVAICGDGIVQTGEECDDGNLDPNDGCDNCTLTCSMGEIPNPQTHHCYLVMSVNASLSWDNAEAECIAHGGHLATITSTEELAFFGDRVKDGAWIGGRGDGMMFVWSNGEPWWSGAPWMAAQPTPSADQCVAIRSVSTVGVSTVFEAHPCTDSLPYICERLLDGTTF